MKDLPGRWDFPHVCEATHSLQEAACESRQGFVLVNLDPNASPLSEQLDASRALRTSLKDGVSGSMYKSAAR